MTAFGAEPLPSARHHVLERPPRYAPFMRFPSVGVLFAAPVGVALFVGSLLSLCAFGCMAGRARNESVPGGTATSAAAASTFSASVASTPPAPTATATPPPPDRVFIAGADI